MDTSHFLAKLIGLMLLIAGAMLIFNRNDRIKLITDNLHNQPAMLMLAGMINVLLGLLIILFHPYWHMNWTLLITLIGYLILAKGLIRLFAPQLTIDWTNRFIQGNGVLITGIVTIVIGLFLTVMGFGFIR